MLGEIGARGNANPASKAVQARLLVTAPLVAARSPVSPSA
jgi:hypothetical protein